MKAYRVVQWNEMHETAESRKLTQPWWFCKPNKADGMAYSRLTAEPDALALYGAWGAILDAASKGSRETRGWLIRNGRALDAQDLALMSRFPQAGLQRGLDFFCSPEMAWLTQEELPDTTPLLALRTAPLALTPSPPAASPGTPAASASPPGEPAGKPANREREREIERKRSREEGGRLVGHSRSSSPDLKVMFAALKDQIAVLERRKEELSPAERDELRKKKRRLELIQEAQAQGKTSLPEESAK